ncbi:BON domain-containing protein [Variovorax sp. J31P207]|uniref:BON domain-containing protein n=1 Tax=Variovorax sp. J31P207 TaxID=3053510 RepID=UPI002576D6AD|nr:BON domain-containing protein [Variovorax sp. J31P207]MDM0068535.1 BON domain-containing protein [Variovorax sp. J31P207]
MTSSNDSGARGRGALALLLTAGVLALGACSKTDNETMGKKVDSAVAKTEQAGADVKAKTESAAASVAGTMDDASITAAVSTGLAKDPDLSAIKIDVDTKGGQVTLSGPAPNAAAKARAEEIAKSVKGVSAVDNRLEVKM